MVAKKRIFVSRDQNLKNHCPSDFFFNEIRRKVGEHKYIDIFEIKFEKKKIFCFKMAAKTSFVTLHNIANLC